MPTCSYDGRAIAYVIRETGLSRNAVSLLYKETAQKVDLNAIDELYVLLECNVCELFEKVKEQ